MSEHRRGLRPLLVGALAAILSAGVTGCAPSLEGNEPKEANKTTPARFGGGAAADGEAGTPTATSAAQKTWGELFTSPELRALIAAALANNRELNVQLQEIIVARNEASARRGEVLPRVGAGARAGVEKVGERTSQGASDAATGLPKNLGDFSFGLNASWEVDVWKKLRSAAKAAGLRYLATVEARNFMVTQVVAEIARSYYELLALDAQIDILTRNVALQTRALEVVKLEKLAARVTELAVQRFEAEVLKNESRLYDLEQERVQTENRINFLVGRYPRPVRRSAAAFAMPPPEGLRAGLPSQLLENRPDVRAAELELEASKLDVKAAKAAFYPALSIDAGAGYRSFNAAHLLTTPESLAYGVAGNLTAPLLNRAGITAQYRSANARQIQAVLRYEMTLLQAFTDVTNQLARLENLRESYARQSRQVATLGQAVEVSDILFQSARADYMEVLLTRRDSLEAEMDLVETKRRRLQAVVDLYQALGGGWRGGAEPDAASGARGAPP